MMIIFVLNIIKNSIIRTSPPCITLSINYYLQADPGCEV